MMLSRVTTSNGTNWAFLPSIVQLSEAEIPSIDDQPFFDETDRQKALKRKVEFLGPGWYSLDDEGVYRKGKFVTYSRIKLVRKEKS